MNPRNTQNPVLMITYGDENEYVYYRGEISSVRELQKLYMLNLARFGTIIVCTIHMVLNSRRKICISHDYFKYLMFQSNSKCGNIFIVLILLELKSIENHKEENEFMLREDEANYTIMFMNKSQI
jgi:hypothetical protein